MMPRQIALATLICTLIVAGCGSSSQNSAGLIPPLINIRHVGGVPPMSSGTTVPIYFEIDVTNQSSESITIDRAQLASSSGGSYDISSRDEFFNTEVPPGETRTVNVAATARVFSVRTSSVEPITIRATVHFDSLAGRFRRIVIQQLGGGLGVPR
ncbi:MAG TPA: hypothetical protein VMS12_07915 [Thermoanaerobaculia bacterium]|nr:hypothetical protein [Thermoanaerobaculia bacterium]